MIPHCGSTYFPSFSLQLPHDSWPTGGLSPLASSDFGVCYAALHFQHGQWQLVTPTTEQDYKFANNWINLQFRLETRRLSWTSPLARLGGTSSCLRGWTSTWRSTGTIGSQQGCSPRGWSFETEYSWRKSGNNKGCTKPDIRKFLLLATIYIIHFYILSTEIDILYI